MLQVRGCSFEDQLPVQYHDREMLENKVLMREEEFATDLCSWLMTLNAWTVDVCWLGYIVADFGIHSSEVTEAMLQSM